MEKYAVIKIGSSQYTVRENDVIEVEKQAKGFKPEVLLVSMDGKIEAGSPILKDAAVKLYLVEEKRDRKIMVGRFKSKSRYHKKRGHRQELSIFKVEKIGVGAAEDKSETVSIKNEAKTEAKVEVQPKAEKKSAEVKKEMKKETKAKTSSKVSAKKVESKKLTKKASK